MADVDPKIWTQTTMAAVALELPFLDESARRLVVAHLALESGFGRSRAAKHGANLGNLTAGSAWKGPCWVDVGGDRNARGELITQTWRIYSSVSSFLADYWRFLGPSANGGRYTSARNELELGRLATFAVQLRAAGYYELAAAEYTARLRAAHDGVLAHLELPPAAK